MTLQAVRPCHEASFGADCLFVSHFSWRSREGAGTAGRDNDQGDPAERPSRLSERRTRAASTRIRRHDASGDGEEVSAVLPVQRLGVHEAQIRLVDRRTRGATEVGSFIPRVLPPKPSQKELFDIGLDGMMRSAPVDGVTGPARPPQPLFPANYFLGAVFARAYDVSRDGRFLMLKETSPTRTVPPASIVVHLNWTDELRKLRLD